MKKISLLLTMVLLAHFMFAQSWQNRSGDITKMNFKEIQNSFKNDVANGTISKTSKKYKQYKRWERIWKDRVLPDGSFVNPAHTYNELQKYNATHSTTRGVANWTFIGPDVLPTATSAGYPGAGRVNCIAFDPANSSIIWVGTPAGGLWKSTDGGSTWSPKTDNIPNLGISDIAINPTNSQIMYLAAGDADAQQNMSIGVLKSTDGGATWITTSLNYSLSSATQTGKILINSTTPSNLIVATSNGIYYSTDAAATWSLSTGTTGVNFNSMVFNAASENTIYAGGSDGNIYTSTNGGQSFSKFSTGAAVGRVVLAVSAADPNYIFAFFQDGSGMKTVDGGANWTTQNMPTNQGGPVATQGGYNMCVAIAPNNTNLIIVGAMNYAYRSVDGGATWEGYLDGYWSAGKPYFYVHSDHHVLKFLPGSNSILFSGNDGGIHKGDITTNNAWTDLSAGLHITQYYGIAGTPQDASYLIAGAQDNDANGWNGTSWWDINNNTDGIDALIDYSNSNIAYVASTSGNFTRTLDGFNTTEQYMNTPASNADFVWPIAMHPTTPTTIYGGWTEIYKSTDKGNTWNPITNNQLGGYNWAHIAIAPSNANVIYAGDAYSVWVTTNGGTSWTDITIATFQNGNVAKMAVSASDPNTAFVCLTGYMAGNKVFKTTDAGANWVNISGTLPNIPVKSIVYQTGSNGDVYIGTDLGVFHIDNSLSDWEAYSTNLPNVIVNDLEIFYPTGKLRAATFGRGIWESPLKSTTSVETLVKKGQFEVSPNPTTGNFIIKLTNKKAEITIYNIAGGVVKQFNTENKESVRVDLSQFSTGMYFVSVKSGGKQQVEKIILK